MPTNTMATTLGTVSTRVAYGTLDKLLSMARVDLALMKGLTSVERWVER